MADRPDGGAADLADALGQDVQALLELLGLLVEQKMVVAKVRATHVPMEVLGLYMERETVGEQRVERSRYRAHRLGRQVGRSVEPCGRPGWFEPSDSVGHRHLLMVFG
jgi:hypothetical protein